MQNHPCTSTGTQGCCEANDIHGHITAMTRRERQRISPASCSCTCSDDLWRNMEERWKSLRLPVIIYPIHISTSYHFIYPLHISTSSSISHPFRHPKPKFSEPRCWSSPGQRRGPRATCASATSRNARGFARHNSPAPPRWRSCCRTKKCAWTKILDLVRCKICVVYVYVAFCSYMS